METIELPQSGRVSSYFAKNAEESLFHSRADDKQLYREATRMSARDRLQVNIGRVQQYEKELYLDLFSSISNHYSLWASAPQISVESSGIGPSVPITFSVDDLAYILTSCEPLFLQQLEVKLQPQATNPEVSSEPSSMLESIVCISLLRSHEIRKKMAAFKDLRISVSSPGSFLSRAKQLENDNRIDKALDLVYASIDQMLRSERFSEVNTLLDSLLLADYSTDVLLTLLTATFPAKSHLPSRLTFYEKARHLLDQRGEDVETLLVGLEK